MDQLTQESPNEEVARRARPPLSLPRIARRFWRLASMLDRLAEMIGWFAG